MMTKRELLTFAEILALFAVSVKVVEYVVYYAIVIAR